LDKNNLLLKDTIKEFIKLYKSNNISVVKNRYIRINKKETLSEKIKRINSKN